MMLFPYDALQSWKGAYPPATVQSLLTKLARRWSEVVALLERIAGGAGKAAALELAIARTCHAHFQSTANKVEFYLLRDQSATVPGRHRMLEIAELELARRQYLVASGKSRIAYEASNHYYYTPADLLEKC